MTVGNIMETNVITINEDATLEQLYSLIGEYHHPGYPVVNKENSEDEHTLERVSPGDSVIEAEAVEKMTQRGELVDYS